MDRLTFCRTGALAAASVTGESTLASKGAAIAGNKIRGIRAALCHDTFCTHQCVEHDDVNLLCLGAWIIGIKLAEEILRAFLGARFSTEEDFRRPVKKLEQLETFQPGR